MSTAKAPRLAITEESLKRSGLLDSFFDRAHRLEDEKQAQSGKTKTLVVQSAKTASQPK
jgi:hypothetical protein